MKRWDLLVLILIVSGAGYWVYRSAENDFNRRRSSVVKRVYLLKVDECRTGDSQEECNKLIQSVVSGVRDKDRAWRDAVSDVIREKCEVPEELREDGEVLDWFVGTEGECFLEGDD